MNIPLSIVSVSLGIPPGGTPLKGPGPCATPGGGEAIFMIF